MTQGRWINQVLFKKDLQFAQFGRRENTGRNVGERDNLGIVIRRSGYRCLNRRWPLLAIHGGWAHRILCVGSRLAEQTTRLRLTQTRICPEKSCLAVTILNPRVHARTGARDERRRRHLKREAKDDGQVLERKGQHLVYLSGKVEIHSQLVSAVGRWGMSQSGQGHCRTNVKSPPLESRPTCLS